MHAPVADDHAGKERRTLSCFERASGWSKPSPSHLHLHDHIERPLAKLAQHPGMLVLCHPRVDFMGVAATLLVEPADGARVSHAAFRRLFGFRSRTRRTISRALMA
jgi:hypothetical protein